MEQKKCTLCNEVIPAQAEACPVCGQSSSMKKCPFCAEEIHFDATKCRFCETRLDGSGKPSPVLPQDRPLGKHRDLLPLILLSFITCGVYQIYHIVVVANEINLHSGEVKLNPVVHVLLFLLTGGLWVFGIAYFYLKAFQEMQLAEGINAPNNALLCIIGFWGVVILQSELNQHWAAHLEQGQVA